jgi:tripartite-type tricarboxylate transporter receptor subunit TctC
MTDFECVSQVVDVPMTLVARKDLPARTFPKMLAYLKAQGDKSKLAHAGLGAVLHLCGMVQRQPIGVDMTTVPYQGAGPAMAALLGGQVDLQCDQTTQTVPQIKAGALRFYGVTTSQCVKVLPDAPTLAERGLKGFEVMVWHGVCAPREATEKFNAVLRIAHSAEGCQLHAAHRRTGCQDRAQGKAVARGPAHLAELRDRPPGGR